jgi:hypothetical protein
VSAGDLPRLRVHSLSASARLVEAPAARLSRATDGAAPRLATALRVGSRAGSLLVRFDARDDGVVATLSRRDAPLWTEDVVEVFLAPEPSPGGVYFEFEVNPLGARFDARVESPEGRRETMRVDVAWNCPGFSARVRRRERRWSALLTIPLAPLVSGPPPALWRANFYRVDRGRDGAPDEFSAWSPTFADPPDFHRPDRFGLLELDPSAAAAAPPDLSGSSRGG